VYVVCFNNFIFILSVVVKLCHVKLLSYIDYRSIAGWLVLVCIVGVDLLPSWAMWQTDTPRTSVTVVCISCTQCSIKIRTPWQSPICIDLLLTQPKYLTTMKILCTNFTQLNSVSVSKTAEQIEILFGVNTLGGPRNIVLDWGLNPHSEGRGWGGGSMQPSPNCFGLLLFTHPF